MNDLTGKQFGRWMVVKRGEDHVTTGGKHLVAWECICSCSQHTVKTITAQALIRGSSRSCGCLYKESRKTTGAKNKKYNTYDLTGDYGIGYTTKGEEFYFDLEDYDKIKSYCWCVAKNEYIVAQDCNNNKVLSMHKLITDCEKDKVIDHKNHNTRDNRKSNLRICTQSQNMCNVKNRGHNTSGYRGVTWNSKREAWQVYVIYEGVRKYIGQFKDKKDAIKARMKAEKEIQGEYSYSSSNDREQL